MELSSGGMAGMVFKPAVRVDFGKLSLDGQMLSVLMNLDGKMTLGQVAQKVGISLGDIQPVISQLLNLSLVERVEQAVSVVDPEFMAFTIARMAIAIGPLGEIIVEDGLDDLGFGKTDFPTQRVAELIIVLSQEIQREDKRIEFKQAMLSKIKEKGY